jgi:cell division transport system permease protein
LVITLYTVERKMPDLSILSDMRLLLMLLGAVILLGIIISWISTFFAVRKYLKIKTDSLYYY